MSGLTQIRELLKREDTRGDFMRGTSRESSGTHKGVDGTREVEVVGDLTERHSVSKDTK